MKFVKMSLAAAMLMGATSALALENVKADGGAALFYESVDDTFNGGIDTLVEGAVNVGLTGEMYGMTLGFRGYATLDFGLADADTTTWTDTLNGEESASWVSELYLAKTFGNTTLKVGRQTLETPLVFTETWNTAPNSFDAILVANTDAPDTTLVGAFIDKSNGSGFTVAEDGEFTRFMSTGAFAFAAINNSYKPLTAQLWYYDASDVASAVWAQADYAQNGFVAGVQYGTLELDAAGTDDSEAIAVKLGYEGVENLSVAVAYSETDEDGDYNFNNLATGFQSPLYTEAWWYMGEVSKAGAESVSFMAEYSMPEIVDLGLYVVDTENDTANTELTEVVVTATKSFGALDTTIAYVDDDLGTAGDDQRFQVYLSTSF